MAAVDGVARRTVLASAMALVGVACATRAQAQIDLVDLAVIDRETGQPLPVWRRDGRQFVAGEQGQRYGLRLINHTDGRVLVVLSVDGVNVISGETARYDQRGYVLHPYETYDINGWRKSTREIAAFAFTALPDSYAAETGRPGDVGVIGMAVFKERPKPSITPLDIAPAPERRSGLDSVVVSGSRIGRHDGSAPPPPLPLPPVEKPMPAPPAPNAVPPAPASIVPDTVVNGRRQAPRTTVAPPPPLPIPPVEKPFPGQFANEAKLGTAHGALEPSFINVVSFERATPNPQLVRQIEYDSYANLLAAGVIPRPSYPAPGPRAFPRNGGAPGFVPDPPVRP